MSDSATAACQLVDSHCHLNFLDHPQAAVERAQAAGVDTMLCIGVDEKTLPAVLAIAQQHAGVWATAGLHPESADTLDPATDSLDWLTAALGQPQVVAVGEMGLDYAQDPSEQSRYRQQHWFEQQLALAKEHDLPVVVHTRNAREDTLDRLQQSGVRQGVLHCFTEDWPMAEAAMELGFYISISGIVTFKNAHNVHAVAARVPSERLLIETDSPWLAPTPHRGKTNEPALLPHTAAYLAELRDESPDELTAVTRNNFFDLFSKISR